MKPLSLCTVGALVALFVSATATEEKPAAKIELDPVVVTGIRPLLKVAEHPMVEPRFAAAVVADGDYLYIIGGSNQEGVRLDSVERVDLRTGQSGIWTRLNIARRHHRAVILTGKIYVLGGTTGPRNPQDPLSEELADYAGDDPPIADGLPPSLLAPPENLLLPPGMPGFKNEPGRAPVEKFSKGFNYVSAVEVIDLATGLVSDGPAMPVPKALFGCVVLDGQILVIGGQQLRGGSIVCTSTTERFDPAANTWSAGVNLPTPRRGTASVVDGFVIFLGGYGGKQAGRTIEVFNPREGFWRRLPDLAEAVNPSSTVWAGRYLFLFGDQGRRSRQLVYDLQAKQLVPYPLALPDSDFAAAVLHRDRIYVVGGASLRLHNTTDAIQIFAPASEIAAANPFPK